MCYGVQAAKHARLSTAPHENGDEGQSGATSAAPVTVTAQRRAGRSTMQDYGTVCDAKENQLMVMDSLEKEDRCIMGENVGFLVILFFFPTRANLGKGNDKHFPESVTNTSLIHKHART